MQAIESENTAVPWKGIDVLLFLILWAGTALWSICIGYVASFSSSLSHLSWREQLAKAGINDPMIPLFGFLFLVVAAPLIEEFIFRLLLQGWLEAKFRQFRISYASSIAIVITSFVFAAAHVSHLIAIPIDCFFMHVTFVILSLSLFTFGIVYLVRKRNVKIVHYLFGTKRFFRPRFFVNAGYCLLALLLCYILPGIVFACSGAGHALYLMHIFFISLIFGTLYSKTQNLSYSILLHALLNGIVFIFIFL